MSSEPFPRGAQKGILDSEDPISPKDPGEEGWPRPATGSTRTEAGPEEVVGEGCFPQAPALLISLTVSVFFWFFCLFVNQFEEYRNQNQCVWFLSHTPPSCSGW